MTYLIIIGVLVFFSLFLLQVVWFNRRKIQALENARRKLIRQKAMTLDLMNRIGLSLNSNLDLDASLGIITNYIVEATEAESGAIFLLHSEGQFLQARTVVGMFPPLHQTGSYVLTKRKYLADRIKKDKIDIKEGIIGFVASSGQALLISDGVADPRVPKFATGSLQINSIIATPIRQRRNVVGVLAVVNKQKGLLFSEDDLHLLQQLSDQAALTIDVVRLYQHQAEQKRIEQELQLARDFQQMMLPRESPRVKNLDIAALSKPAREVGGDYFDFIWVDEKHLGIVIVDVAGKGIPGALAVAMIRSSLKAAAPNNLSPRDVLRSINARLKEDTRENVFITVSYAIIDIESYEMVFVRAGHEPLLTWNAEDEKPQLISPRGIALGLVPDETFDLLEERRLHLKRGDTAVFYTDGVIEATNRSEEEYGLDHFLPVMVAQPKATSREMIQNVVQDIEKFTHGIAQQDDITLVAIKVGLGGDAA